jgi:UDP-glucose 4-epimerase
MSTTVLVTGATGYIGSHVCKHLLDAGYRVVGVDRVSRDHALPYMTFLINEDYYSDGVVNFLNSETVHAVVHCAGTSLVGPSVLDPAEYYTNNVAKTAMFLDVLRRLPNPPAFVFSSSASVYGSPDVDIITEDTPWNPVSPYGQTKAMIELMLTDMCKAYNMAAMSLRYFNACGADVDSGALGQAPGATHIIARLLESIRDRKQFILYGNDYNTPDGSCIRDYVHVDDLARAHVYAIQYLLSFEHNQHYMVNLGSGRGYSNVDVIAAVARHIGPVDLLEGSRRAGDPDRLVASNDLAQAYLGWSPEHSDLETIITSAWRWYNNTSNLVDTASK